MTGSMADDLQKRLDAERERPMRRCHVPGCPTCDRYAPGDFFPPHDASQRCESGKHTHCTCDTCF